MTAAYPLHWPDGWPRTPERDRRRSPFRVTPDQAKRNLLDQLRMLGAHPGRTVISSNVAVKQDGSPYADASRRIIRDPGVAVYFFLDGEARVMARDAFDMPFENIHSIGHAIEAMRALERHGGAMMMKRAFAGFAALPPPEATRPWFEVLQVLPDAPAEVIEAAFRAMAKRLHPDAGGSEKAMAELNAARDQAIKERAA
jgi:hypothetical protein